MPDTTGIRAWGGSDKWIDRKVYLVNKVLKGALVVTDTAEERDGGPCSCRGRWQVPTRDDTRG